MKSAVIFASWIKHKNRSIKYINLLKEHFSDYDIYVGINPSAGCHEWAAQLANSGLNIQTILVNKDQYNNSDASAFQAALKLYKEADIDYEYVHFIHTKGASYSQHKWVTAHREYFLPACNYREKAEKFLDEHPIYGGWGRIGTYAPSKHGKEVFQRYFKGDGYVHQNTAWFMTFYTIRGEIVKNFVDSCEDRFFTDKLDRYFFETNFPLIVDEHGYVRFILEWWKNKNTNENILKEWLKYNGRSTR